MERALFAPAEPLLGLPAPAAPPHSPGHLVSCTQTTPALHVPACSTARTPQNHPGFVTGEGCTQVFPGFEAV